MTDSPAPVSGAVTPSLVERLRKRTYERSDPAPNGWGYVKREHPDPLCQKAADEIERLSAELDASTAAVQTLDAVVNNLNDECARLRSQGGVPEFDKDRIREVIADGPGHWRTCSGCHESEDGHDVGFYPHSELFGCKIGGGCSECGGLGFHWDATDYSDIGKTLYSAPQPPEGVTGWKTPDDLPELKDGDRFAVYLAFDTGGVKLADWVAWTETASEYHASTGVYLGQSPQDGDALYMTDDGFDVRKGDDGRWVSYEHHDDGTKTAFYVTAWTEALKPLPSPPGQGDRTSASQETDGSLNHSALPRKDVEGATPDLDANARLIAAAPEMKEALNRAGPVLLVLAAMLDGEQRREAEAVIAQIHSALAKASAPGGTDDLG